MNIHPERPFIPLSPKAGHKSLFAPYLFMMQYYTK